jgi:CRISPR system Cascade subunit CasB
MSNEPYEDRLVKYLCQLEKRKDRGALAALRTGLGKRPGEAPRMFPHLSRFLESADTSNSYVVAAFATAALFAMHPVHVERHSLGLALWHSTKSAGNPNGKHGEDGVEARFTAALDAHPDDIVRHLQGLISLCESAGKGLDWAQFRTDLYFLLGDDQSKRENVRFRWARDFWRGPSAISESETSEGNE